MLGSQVDAGLVLQEEAFDLSDGGIAPGESMAGLNCSPAARLAIASELPQRARLAAPSSAGWPVGRLSNCCANAHVDVLLCF